MDAQRSATGISACLIVRDEAGTLRACLESLRPHVDEIVVVDTGSEDESPGIAREYADVWERWTDCIDDQGLITDFAAPRNHASELASHPWMLWLDGDDVLVGGELLRGLTDWLPPDDELVALLVPYEYSHDDAGRCTVLQYRERLVCRREDFIWQCPVHEGCLPRATGKRLTTRACDELRVVHRHPPGKVREPGRNLRLLEAYVERSGEGDHRALFYLGLERAAAGRFAAARSILERYVEVATWRDERCLAMLELSALYGHDQQYETAVAWALRATQEKSWPAPYWAMGRAYYSMARSGVEPELNFRRALGNYEIARFLGEHESTVLLQRPQERYEAERHANVCHAAIGDYAGAAESCRRGLAGLPGDHDLEKNLAIYERELAKERIVSDARALRMSGALESEGLALIEATVSGAARVKLSPVDRSTTNRRLAEREPAPGKYRVILYTGPALEPWTPASLEQNGMGGSETMAWLVARELGARGHSVRVYAHHDGDPLELGGGVQWYDYRDFGEGLECDVLITSRRPGAAMAPVSAHARVLWVHDIHCGTELTPEAAQRIDRIWCLTDWHRRVFCESYPWLQQDKVVQIRNALDLNLWRATFGPRNPHRAVYSSSPDRGLSLALSLWWRVRERVSDAELHVYYGFENWRACVAGDANALAAIDRLEALAASTEGVTLHGRISESQLAHEFSSSGVWAYPTWWWETSCLTAMQALASGLCVVTTDLAGLRETVDRHGLLLAGEYASREYRDAWVDGVVRAMTDDGCIGAARCNGPKEARKRFGIRELIDDLEDQLSELVEQPVVPPYSEEGL